VLAGGHALVGEDALAIAHACMEQPAAAQHAYRLQPLVWVCFTVHIGCMQLAAGCERGCGHCMSKMCASVTAAIALSTCRGC
jgi:hypothetical protein